jgi:hypothetical protein
LPASTGTVSREYVHSAIHEDGNEVVTKFVEQVPRERVLKYLPIGNYKWCVPLPLSQEWLTYSVTVPEGLLLRWMPPTLDLLLLA